MADFAKGGLHGVQLRANVLPRFGEKPAELKDLVHNELDFACCSVGNVPIGPNARFVEPGRAPVDLPGAFTALADVGYRGRVILELDAVPDAGGSANASMLTSKRHLEQVLKLTL